MKHDDRQLLLRTHRGHEASARELWARFSPRLLAYARSIVGSGAEDVVQSVFLAVLAEPRSSIKRVEDAAAWLLVLTRRSALNHMRTTRRAAARDGVASRVPRDNPTAGVYDGASLSSAMGLLPRRLREVVVLRHMAGLTFDQVALALGAKRNTTAARYREAIRRLRLMLVEGDGESAVLLSAATGSLP